MIFDSLISKMSACSFRNAEKWHQLWDDPIFVVGPVNRLKRCFPIRSWTKECETFESTLDAWYLLFHEKSPSKSENEISINIPILRGQDTIKQTDKDRIRRRDEMFVFHVVKRDRPRPRSDSPLAGVAPSTCVYVLSFLFLLMHNPHQYCYSLP